jgi:SAM-dependent methyltransferase
MSVKKILKKLPFAQFGANQIHGLVKKQAARAEKAEFKRQYDEFVAASDPSRFSVLWKDRFPILDEKTVQTGYDRHYVYHTAWAARCLAQTKPAKHIDISSSLYFSALCSAFVPIEFYDFRPADLILSNLTCKTADLTKLHFKSNSIASLSCMHTIEHIGLGRYGDELDPQGDLKAIAELQRVLAPGGNFFFVVPVGRPRIMFNAHRIYGEEQIIRLFSQLKLVNFSVITENFADGGLIDSPPAGFTEKQEYACGCFWFTKEKA